MKKEPFLVQESLSDYVAPEARSLPFEVESVLCDSPLPGGNEDIGFENWG